MCVSVSLAFPFLGSVFKEIVPFGNNVFARGSRQAGCFRRQTRWLLEIVTSDVKCALIGIDKPSPVIANAIS